MAIGKVQRTRTNERERRPEEVVIGGNRSERACLDRRPAGKRGEGETSGGEK